MKSSVEYGALFKGALQAIKNVRAPHTKKLSDIDSVWEKVKEQQLFDFGDANFEKHSNVISFANNISLQCLYQIIIQIIRSKNLPLSSVKDKPRDIQGMKMHFAFKDNNTNEILFFSEIAESAMWRVKGAELEGVDEFLLKQNATGCKYIFFMKDYAYLQIIGHNDDSSDPGRGYNFYSIKWFIETYVGEEEYKKFEEALDLYNESVKEYLGYSTVKSLTPSSLVNFRKKVEKELLEYQYDKLVDHKIVDQNDRELTLSFSEQKKLEEQFIDNRNYLVMLGESDFAESLITAEWLYDSMKKAKAIDLTVIGMGYFKAIEQLLFGLICLHKNEGRCIRKVYSRNNHSSDVELNDKNIAEEVVDSTLGSMAIFFKKNPDILREDLHHYTKNYVKEAIFKYVALRNGYLHKHNIRQWRVIDEIREATYNMMFLLIGSYTLTNENLTELKIAKYDIFTDYYKLCEYLNYHSNEMFYVKINDEYEDIFISLNDPNMDVSEDKYITYSGLYFRDFDPRGRRYHINEENLPQEIWSAKFDFGNNELPNLQPVKASKIFENGKFLGTNIASDEEFDY